MVLFYCCSVQALDVIIDWPDFGRWDSQTLIDWEQMGGLFIPYDCSLCSNDIIPSDQLFGKWWPCLPLTSSSSRIQQQHFAPLGLLWYSVVDSDVFIIVVIIPIVDHMYILPPLPPTYQLLFLFYPTSSATYPLAPCWDCCSVDIHRPHCRVTLPTWLMTLDVGLGQTPLFCMPY